MSCTCMLLWYTAITALVKEGKNDEQDYAEITAEIFEGKKDLHRLQNGARGLMSGLSKPVNNPKPRKGKGKGVA